VATKPSAGDKEIEVMGGTGRSRLARAVTELGEGRKIKMALAAQSSGSEVGWLADRFGINWLVGIAKS
jgi:uncharacterized glyoxalase superfamily protein PhnB